MKTLKDFRTYINENFEESGNLSSKLQAFLNGKEKRDLFLFGYSLPNDCNLSWYSKRKAPGPCHNHNDENKLIQILHNKNFIDATFCAIQKKN
ncbi:MAG: hypothetical protein ACOC3Z_02590 [Nanoarchaeota archaeon]